MIKSLPISKKTTFTVDDFTELIQIVSNNLDMDQDKEELFKDKLMHKEVLRPTKIYNMLASRACRQSIMIGKTLDYRLMNKVVSNLATLQSPWNCPHGRPTLRFLRRLSKVEQKQQFNNQGDPILNC
jgi:DNA mismatch repair protein PMS2